MNIITQQEIEQIADENADIYAAYQQLQTYKSSIPSLFQYNFFMIANGKTADGENVVDTSTEPEMEPMLKGILKKENLPDLIRCFIVFEKSKDKTFKNTTSVTNFSKQK